MNAIMAIIIIRVCMYVLLTNTYSVPKNRVFNTFFYSKLCNNGYEGVQKWSKVGHLLPAEKVTNYMHACNIYNFTST